MKPRLLGLDHIQLAAPPGSESEARWFFGELLELPEIDKPPPLQPRGGVWFALGSHQLHIGIDEQFTPARKAHPALLVAPGELDALASRLETAGIEVLWDDAIPGVRRFFVSDPWGNRIELVGG
jgi:catechol 2,3-dioxygenase-like lactoylglutathione lyase family enzyme